MRIAIITASSTRSLAEDTAGAALIQRIHDAGWELSGHVLVKDDRATIAAAIIAAADGAAFDSEMVDGQFASDKPADIILTCGGSGLSPLDVTPEATADVCERNVPGIAEAMRASSLQKTRRAMLSRAVCMQRGRTLVINLPGSEKAATECFDAVADQLEHAVSMAAGGGH